MVAINESSGWKSLGFIMDIANLSMDLPGVMTKVDCPCGLPALPPGIFFEYGTDYCRYKEKTRVWFIIQYLNDEVKWSREKIADWLDELHESGIVDIEFQPWNEGDGNEDTRED